MDNLDMRLLVELDKNCRQSYLSLGKKLRVSKDTVKYRMDKLVREGVIKGYSAIIDTGKLGLTAYRLLVQTASTTPEAEDKMRSFLLSLDELCWLVEVGGEWDLNMFFLCENPLSFNDIYTAFIRKFGQYISRCDLGIFSEVEYYDRAFLSGKSKHVLSMKTVTIPKKIGLDKTDKHIVKILDKDARRSIVSIAKDLGIATKTALRKVRSLEKRGVIVGYRTILDLEKLGFRYYKVHIETDSGHPELSTMEAAIADYPYVVYRDRVIGGYKIEVELQVRGDKDIEAFISWMKKMFPGRIRTCSVLRYVREHRLRFTPENLE